MKLDPDRADSSLWSAASAPTPTAASNPTPINANGLKRKRVNLLETRAAITTRQADARTNLEVDHMILDYLAYDAIQTCLDSRQIRSAHRPSHEQVERSISLVEDQLSLFRSQHPHYEWDQELRLRLLLLKFTSLFTQRYAKCSTTPSQANISRLRDANALRARKWIGHGSRLPTLRVDTFYFENRGKTSPQRLTRIRAATLQAHRIPPENGSTEAPFYGTTACVSLLDLLPLFMEVSATFLKYCNKTVNTNWLRMAAEMMQQACLEQYVIFDQDGTDAIDEAFAWGYKDPEADDESSPIQILADDRSQLRDKVINEMFHDEDENTEVVDWARIRDAALHDLLPPDGDSIDGLEEIDHHHRDLFAKGLHLVTIEGKVLDFLRSAASLDAPVLVQLEKGKLDGMTEAETAEFLRDCGIRENEFARS